MFASKLQARDWFEIGPVSKLLDLRERANVAVHRENSVGHNQPEVWHTLNLKNFKGYLDCSKLYIEFH